MKAKAKALKKIKIKSEQGPGFYHKDTRMIMHKGKRDFNSLYHGATSLKD